MRRGKSVTMLSAHPPRSAYWSGERFTPYANNRGRITPDKIIRTVSGSTYKERKTEIPFCALFRLFFFVGEVVGINVLVFIFVFVGIDILIVKLIVGEIITLAVRKIIVFVLFLTLAQGMQPSKARSE